MSIPRVTCNLPGRQMDETRFCRHPEVAHDQEGVIVPYSQCFSCPFRNINNTVIIDSGVVTIAKDQLPGVVEQTTNFVRTMFQVVADGGKIVDEKEKQDRLAVCSGCEYYDKEAARCIQCGCYLNWKSMLKAGVCPLGKWETKK